MAGPGPAGGAAGGLRGGQRQAGAAISVAGAVVSTGVTLGGKAVGAGIDALSGRDDASDGSGIVVREHIRPAAPTPAPGTGNAPLSAPLELSY